MSKAPINSFMKISELIVPKINLDTTSSGTIYSISDEDQTQDIMPQNHVPEKIVAEMVDNQIIEQPDHSAIAEGVSQILRRKPGGAPSKGFRCTSGPRKGRIVAKPSTCFSKLNPSKGAKIRAKRRQKMGIAGKRLAQTKRTGAGSVRLKGAQIKKRSMKGKSTAPKMKARSPLKSKIVRPKK